MGFSRSHLLCGQQNVQITSVTQFLSIIEFFMVLGDAQLALLFPLA